MIVILENILVWKVFVDGILRIDLEFYLVDWFKYYIRLLN